MSGERPSFEGRIAVVTGAASGIGKVVATRLVREGASVVGVDRDEPGLERLAAEIETILPVVADVSDEASVASYVERTVDAHGRVDLFFNNAGIEGTFSPIVDLEMADFDAVIAVNVRGVFLGLRAVPRQMQRQGAGGAIVNTASMGGVRGGSRFSPYIASNHAVVGLSRAAAHEGAPFGIRVNAVAPGHIDTRMARNLSVMANPENPQAAQDERESAIPLKRYGTADEVANVVCFLLSDEASYATGAISSIDAGLTA